jgi:predicted ATPase
VQILVESHSEHLLRRLQRRVAEGSTEWEIGVERNDVALYFCNTTGTESVLVPLQLDLYGSITNWPRDFFGDELEDLEAMALAQALRRGRSNHSAGGGK